MYQRKINWKKGLVKTGAILCIFLLFVLSVSLITSVANASKGQQYIEVNVQPGDSLWKIADKYDNNKVDLRKIIYEIKKINNIDHIIYPGQVLKIPVY